MSLRKIGLLGLLALSILIIPTGCKKDRPLRVNDIEERTSAAQLDEWLEQLPAIVRSTGLNGAETSRMLAYASIAYYEGYAYGFEDMRTLVGQVQGLNELPSPDPELGYSFGIVAEAAMKTVLLHQFQDASTNIKLVINSTYVDHEREFIVAGIGSIVVQQSKDLGEQIGKAINDWSELDGYGAVVNNCSLTIPSGAASWQPTPPSFSTPELPCWGDLRAFTFSPDQLIVLCHPGAPDPVSNQNGSAYLTDIDEVIQVTADLTPEQKKTVDFWKDDEGTFTVPGHYVSILSQLIDQKQLNGKQAVTSFAQLCIAMADTYISTYKLKYTYFRPRPLSFVQTHSNVNWESYLTNPRTPEYPSLRSTMAFAATQVFINLYGNEVAFTDDTQSIFNMEERAYSSFNEMANEAVYSRLYAGTNLRTTLENSEYHGRCIAQRANELFFNQ